MSRQDIKGGLKSSEFLHAQLGLWIGAVAMAAGAVVAALWALEGGCVLTGSGGVVAAVSVASYQLGRSRIKASAHAPPPVVAGGQVF